MVLSIIAEAARGAFGGTDVESEIRLKRYREAEQKKKAAAIVAALEKASADKENSAGQKPAERGSFFGGSKPADITKKAEAPAAAKTEPAAPSAAAAPAEQPAAAAPAAGSMPDGNVKQGAALFKAKCATCHTCNEGGPNKQGPNLFGILGKTAGTIAGFGYTAATKNAGHEWNDQTMFDFLTNPKKFIKGTSMAFPGFKKEQDRADVVAYLNTLK